MAALVIDGAAIAAKARGEAAKGAAKLIEEKGVVPCLAVILAGDNPASASYVAGKTRALAEAGMKDRTIRLSRDVPQAELLQIIARLNTDATVHGILVQLPLPSHIDSLAIISAIDPKKDVDGFHPINLGNMVSGGSAFIPCTPRGVLYLLREAGIATEGARAVIVGRSNIVGKPLSILLSSKECNATVTLCHTATRNLAEITQEADILVAAVGRPAMITANMVKPGAAVIDVGVNRVPDASKKSGFRLMGDVDFDAVKEKAAFITPVPKGVGPMTIAMLMQNTLEAACLACGANLL